ncbi:MAG: ParA family protein [Hydrogenophilus sp.]|nr:ParA family protein [Hydrogenophilus sp.]
MSSSPSLPRILAIANRKGGTGKTTVAVNLAAELAARGLRVWLLDLDTQNHVAFALGITPRRGATLHTALFTPNPLPLETTIHSTPYRIDLTPADPTFSHDLASRYPLTTLAAALAPHRHRYDWLILDTPPSFDALLLNALHAANRLLIPFIPHPLAFEGVRLLLRLFYQTRQRHNPALRLIGFLPTQTDERLRLHRRIHHEIAARWGDIRLLPPIHRDIKLAEAMATGTPIRLYAPNSHAARDFLHLTDELLARDPTL